MHDVMTAPATERFDIALNTPAGRLTTAVEVPTGFVPVTAIVPQSAGAQGGTALFTVLITLDPTKAQILPGMTGRAEIEA